MSLHLRPVPEDVEFCSQSPGLYYNGRFIAATPGEVRVIEALFTHRGQYLTAFQISHLAGLSISSARVMVSRARKSAHFMGYAIINGGGNGYIMRAVGT